MKIGYMHDRATMTKEDRASRLELYLSQMMVPPREASTNGGWLKMASEMAVRWLDVHGVEEQAEPPTAGFELETTRAIVAAILHHGQVTTYCQDSVRRADALLSALKR